MVLPACVGEGGFDGGTKCGSAEPGTGVKELADAVVRDFAEI
jgi:hypothetical protein